MVPLEDDRAQSVQIGAVLLFAVLLIAFSIYQAVIVPGQNERVEFNHHERVQQDMIEVRNTILETFAGGNDGYAEVELGTNYPARLLALNPSPPTGSLRSTEARPIVIEEQGGGEITDAVCPGSNIQTRFLEYDPTYVQFREAGTLRFENSLLYNDVGATNVTLTGQSLVAGDRVQVIPIQREINVGGSRTVAVEPKAGLLDTSIREDITVTLPTRLSESRWEDVLDGQVAPADVSVTSGAGGRNLTLTLDGSRRIECGPVGLGQTPASGSRGGGIDEINPAAPGDIRLVDEVRSGATMTLTFNNTGGTNNFTEARINFFEAQGGSEPTQADIAAVGQPVSATLTVGGDFETLNPKIQLVGQGTETQVEITFDQNLNPNDWFILTIRLETGETGLYFIPAG